MPIVMAIRPGSSPGSEVWGVTGSSAPALAPIASIDIGDYAEANRKSITGAASYGNALWANDCYYTVTGDLSISGSFLGLATGGNFLTGPINNCCIDLNGKTITFGAVAGNNYIGIDCGRSYNIVIKNGTLVLNSACANNYGHIGIRVLGKVEVINVDIIMTSINGNNISYQQAEGYPPDLEGGRVHGCFLWNQEGYIFPIGYAAGTCLTIQGMKDVEAYDNLMVGGHITIGTQGVYDADITAEYGVNSVDVPFDASALIHHNKIFATRRVIGVKSSSGIEIYAASNSKVYENQIHTIDSRGVIIQMSPKNVDLYNNTIDARYTRECPDYWDDEVTYDTGDLCASGSKFYESIQDGNLNHVVTDTEWWSEAGYFGYADNNIYGLWLRHGQVDRVSDLRAYKNIFWATNNLTISNAQCWGILLTSGRSAASAWSNSTIYKYGDLCTSGGVVYESLLSSNQNHAVSDASWWKVSSEYYTEDVDVYSNYLKATCAVGTSIYAYACSGQNNDVKIRDGRAWAAVCGSYGYGNNNTCSVYGNTWVRPSSGWSEEYGSYIATIDVHDNTQEDEPADLVAPSAPTGVAISSPYTGVVLIKWDRHSSHTNNNPMRYNVYKNAAKINTEESGPVGTTFYVDLAGTLADTYTVTAVNTTGTEGDPGGVA